MGDFYGTGIEIWAEFGPNGQLSSLHSFKIFRKTTLDVYRLETFSIVSCSIRDTSPRDFFIMTLCLPESVAKSFAITHSLEMLFCFENCSDLF